MIKCFPFSVLHVVAFEVWNNFICFQRDSNKLLEDVASKDDYKIKVEEGKGAQQRPGSTRGPARLHSSRFHTRSLVWSLS